MGDVHCAAGGDSPRHRKLDTERAASPRYAPHFHRSAVGADDGLNDAETEAAAVALAGEGLINLIKAVEDARLVVGCDADAVIRHGKHHLVAFGLDGEFDDFGAVRVFARV